jgi:hypothetical protein
VLLAAGSTVAAAAGKAGVAAPTVWGWLRVPGFKARVRQLRGVLTEQASGVLAEGMTAAAWALRRLLRSKSASVRLKAADLLLTHAREMATVEDLQHRLEQLESDRVP